MECNTLIVMQFTAVDNTSAKLMKETRNMLIVYTNSLQNDGLIVTNGLQKR